MQAFSEPSGCQGLGHNDNNKTPNLKEDRGFVVLVAGLVTLAGTPRSAIINGVLCLIKKRIFPPRKAKRFATAKRLFSRKARFTLRSVTANVWLIRLLISPLKGIINTFFNRQLVPQVRPYSRTIQTAHPVFRVGCLWCSWPDLSL